MPIPINIERQHILQAINKIQREGVPKRRNSRRFVLNHNGESFPCKLVISWANIYANGEELNYNPKNFQTYSARKYLEELGFVVHDADK